MTLQITPTTGTTGIQSTERSKSRQAFDDLAKALQSGDMNAAKTAYDTLTAGKTPPAGSPMAKLGDAIKSGDASGAASAMQAMKSQRGGHHHHHAKAADSADRASSTTTPVNAATATTGGLLNTVA